MSVLQDTAADEVASEELTHLQDGTASKVGVLHHERHAMGCGVRIGSLLCLDLLLLVCQADATEETECDGCSYNAQNAKRIGAGIAIGDGRSISSEDLIAGFRGSTKARGVCDGSTKDAHHHGEAARIGCVRGSSVVEDEEIEAYAAQHIEQDDTHRHQVQLHASFLEALEEARTNLQAYAIDEEDESEVLNEGQYIICSRKAEVSGHDTRKKHEGDTQRDATHLNASQANTNGDDQCIEQNDVCHAISRKKQRLQPIHNI